MARHRVATATASIVAIEKKHTNVTVAASLQCLPLFMLFPFSLVGWTALPTREI